MASIDGRMGLLRASCLGVVGRGDVRSRRLCLPLGLSLFRSPRQAVAILAPQTSRNQRAAARRLAERNPCMICEINPRRRGWLSDAELAKAKDQTRLRLFAEALAPLWQGNCCPQCIGAEPRGRLCRHHLEAAIMAKHLVNLDDDYRYLSSLLPPCGVIATATAPKTSGQLYSITTSNPSGRPSGRDARLITCSPRLTNRLGARRRS